MSLEPDCMLTADSPLQSSVDTATAGPRLQTAVIGAGLLGIDLVHRICGSPSLVCALVVGGPNSARGLRLAADMGCAVSTAGWEAVTAANVDVVFDASNASGRHWAELASTGAVLLDLTPRSSGTMVVPTVNAHVADSSRYLNLVSCGGQAVLPVIDVIARHSTPGAVQYVEVVTTAAAASVGRHSRLNLDEYIATTQKAVQQLILGGGSVNGKGSVSGKVKVLANITPALPSPAFRAEVAAVAAGVEEHALRADLAAAAVAVRRFAPGYQIAACKVDNDVVRASVTVTATGGRLPSYAGNVEIINAAAVLLAERRAAMRKA
jgi:acetaldehyde dehydrogenase